PQEHRNMNKTELIAEIADYTDMSKRTIEAVLDAQAKVVARSLTYCDAGVDAEVVLPGLGKLKSTVRAARTGRNPQTGAAFEIPERCAVKSSACKALDDRLNPR